jgi:antiviral helicase SLH1
LSTNKTPIVNFSTTQLGVGKTKKMSPSLETAESEWLSQLAAMRAAISELNLSKSESNTPFYGQDLLSDDEDIVPIQGNDDLWDLISEISEEAYTSEEPGTTLAEQLEVDGATGVYDRAWLSRQCAAVSSRKSGLEANALLEQVEAILASDSNGKLN